MNPFDNDEKKRYIASIVLGLVLIGFIFYVGSVMDNISSGDEIKTYSTFTK